ncbi:MAG: hypothetical protein P4L58_00625, partial [Candidatus Pacebacteria bacterium]|nr:hypothetical protein [Candidatus Paceibacterota bacterium]
MSILKKIFFFCLFLFALSLLLWGIYNLSFSNTNTAGQNSSANPAAPQNGKNDSAKNSGTITALVSEAVLAPALTPNGQSVKYFSKDGNGLYEINLDGSNKNTLDS